MTPEEIIQRAVSRIESEVPIEIMRIGNIPVQVRIPGPDLDKIGTIIMDVLVSHGLVKPASKIKEFGEKGQFTPALSRKRRKSNAA